ncbi:MAG: hypothetical protein N3H31_00600 [Candidatus Nezhaarchaeota archaeon]|nr:hypothetical protein [Candidatus Nezhaarchaeota archaeon]
MHASMVNRALVILTLAVLIGVFRIYTGPLALPLLGLAVFLGLLGAGLMWMGLTHKSREELESLPEKARVVEPSSGLYEILLVITIIAAFAIAVGILLIAI